MFLLHFKEGAPEAWGNRDRTVWAKSANLSIVEKGWRLLSLSKSPFLGFLSASQKDKGLVSQHSLWWERLSVFSYKCPRKDEERKLALQWLPQRRREPQGKLVIRPEPKEIKSCEELRKHDFCDSNSKCLWSHWYASFFCVAGSRVITFLIVSLTVLECSRMCYNAVSIVDFQVSSSSVM